MTEHIGTLSVFLACSKWREWRISCGEHLGRPTNSSVTAEYHLPSDTQRHRMYS